MQITRMMKQKFIDEKLKIRGKIRIIMVEVRLLLGILIKLFILSGMGRICGISVAKIIDIF